MLVLGSKTARTGRQFARHYSMDEVTGRMDEKVASREHHHLVAGDRLVTPSFERCSVD
jgi:hypothetical protein